MKTETLYVVLVCLSMYAVANLVYAIVLNRMGRKYRNEARADRTREQFGLARAELLRLASAGQIDNRSHLFRYLYSFHTFVLRRPDHYREIGDALSTSLEMLRKGVTPPPPDDEVSRALEQDIKLYAPVLRKVFKHSVKGLSLILFEFSPLRRMSVRFEFWSKRCVKACKPLMRVASRALSAIADALEGRDPNLHKVHEIKAQFERATLCFVGPS